MKTFLIFLVVGAAVVGGAVFFARQGSELVISPSPTASVAPSASPTVLKDGQYKLDPGKSNMTWQGQKTLIKTWIDRGTISLKSGSVTVKDGKATEGNVVVDMATIMTLTTGKEGGGQDQQSKHLKSADFFDVVKYPTAEFKLTSLEKDASSPDGYTVKGTLKLKDATRPVTFPATVTADGDTLTMKASAQLDRTQWNVRYGSDKFFDNLGDNVIDDNFTVTFTAVANRVTATPTPSASPKVTPTK